MIDHVNYQVPKSVVHSGELTQFMSMLGLEEVEPNEAMDAQYTVRWWQDVHGMRVHIVGKGDQALRVGLGHLCVQVHPFAFEQCLDGGWLERYNPDSPMNRCWLRGPGGIRVEVQCV